LNKEEEAMKNEQADFSREKVPPQNLEAEQAALGGILLDNRSLQVVQEIISAGSFYSEAHRIIFSAMVDTLKERGSVDFLVLNDELKRRNQIDKAGGSAYICSLVDNIASAVNIEYYAKIVKRKALLRQIISGCQEHQEMAYEDRESTDEVLASLQGWLDKILKQSAEGEASQKLSMSLEHLQNYFADCRETPFRALNRAISGFFGGQLIIVGARGGMGKTAFVHALLRYTAIQEERPAMYFGAEMSWEVIFTRLLSSMCRVPYNIIKNRRNINAEQAKLLFSAHKKIETARINGYVIKDKISAVSIMAQVKKYQEEIKDEIGFIVIENLDQIIWPEEKFRRDERYKKDEIDTILSSLRSFGLEMKIPIIISCQINRNAEDREDKRPELSDLKGTGNIEQIADIVLFPFRPEYYKRDKQLVAGPEPAELIIAKGGPPITMPMLFFGEYLCWEEVA
jgi:replicative DNA helicase